MRTKDADGETAKWSNQQDLKISIYESKDRKKKKKRLIQQYRAVQEVATKKILSIVKRNTCFLVSGQFINHKKTFILPIVNVCFKFFFVEIVENSK